MSLEESMQVLAESNLKLAAAMENYANVMQSVASANPEAIITANVTTAASTTPDAGTTEPKRRGRRTQAEIAADAKKDVEAQAAAAATTPEVDPFGDDDSADEPAKALTAEDIRTLVMGVKASKGADAALAIIKAVGVDTLSKIPESAYGKVVDLCKKQGVTL